MCLRYNIDLTEINNQLEKSTYSMVDAAGIIRRILSRYEVNNVDDDGEAIGEECPDCGELNYVREGGCRKCLSCGFSECG